MTGQRKALIVANDQYEHDGMRRLLAPAADAEALGAVLSDRHVGDFAVKVLRNEPAHVIQAHIEEMFADSRSEDVLLLHFSCHGLKSESGELFFAAPNTRPNRLGSTAVSADFVQRCMRTARSRSIVLLLDCCYGGAFARGVTVRAAGDIDVLGSFPHERLSSGRGRAVITASSAMEYAFEGEQLADGEPRPSVFTTALVEGLSTGDADRDQDGWVSLNELYDYVFDKVRERNPHQTPSRAVEMQGELFIARRSRPVTTPAPVPAELLQAVDHPLAGIRVGAVQELARLLGGSHAGLALGARQALERLAADDSRAVSAAAVVALRMGSVADPPVPAAEPELPAPEAAAAGPELPVVERAEPAKTEPGKTEPGEAPPGAEPAEVPDVPPARASAPAEVSAASPVPAAAPDLWLLSAGVLAIIAGVLAVAALYVIYAADFRLISSSSDTAQIVIGSAIALVAGLSTFVPAVSRLTSAGLLLGAAATTPGDLILTIVTLKKSGDTPGPGVWLVIIAEILLLLTAGLVVVSLIRRHYLRGVPRPPMTLASWVMVVLGVVGAAAFFFQVMNRDYIPGLGANVKGTNTLVGPVIWITAMAVIVPLVAVRLPRPFGVALVAGWIVTALAEVPYYTGFSAGLFGYSLLALLVVLIFYARGAASHQPPGRADPLSSAIS
jgi:Caspase domain